MKSGAIVKISSERGSALAVVDVVDKRAQKASVWLLSPDLELGSSNDLILTPRATKLPYSLMAESDIKGRVDSSRLGQPLGFAPSKIVKNLRALQNEDVVTGKRAGPPLTERGDPRWNFKFKELARLVNALGRPKYEET